MIQPTVNLCVMQNLLSNMQECVNPYLIYTGKRQLLVDQYCTGTTGLSLFVFHIISILSIPHNVEEEFREGGRGRSEHSAV